jgi:hypothetical protein
MLPRLEFDRVRVVAAIRHPLPQQGQHPRVEALLYLVQSVGGLVPLTVNTRPVAASHAALHRNLAAL